MAQDITLREAVETVATEFNDSSIKIGVGIEKITGRNSFMREGGYVDQGRFRAGIENGASFRVERGDGGRSTVYIKENANSLETKKNSNLSMRNVQEEYREFHRQYGSASKGPQL